MWPDAKRKASELIALLLTPLRARSHVVEKLGARWAILADSLVVGASLGVIAALAVDVSGEARLGIFAGVVVVVVVAGAAVGWRRSGRPEKQNDTQP